MPQKTRLGIIGAGMMGRLHLEQFSKCGDVEITAIADSNQKRLDQAVAEFGVAVGYADGAHLIAEADVDAVVIAVPNRMHAALAIAAF